MTLTYNWSPSLNALQIKFRDEPRENTKHIVPRLLFNEALNTSEKMIKTTKRMALDLTNIRLDLQAFGVETDTAYLNGCIS